ncbi:MAG: hypothetical protein IPG88_07765 [Gemmatimonadetes bacterium]|nr:hypothetical protein [Gemmatimonadota bacterium]
MTPTAQRMCALAPRSACTIRRTISGARAVARAVGAGVLALVATVGGARRVQAQAPLSVRGSVVRQTLDGTRVVSRELVTLHRVNSREAGPIDSMTTDAKGTFAFRVASPDSLSMYLASARYGGIAYFSQPMQAGQVAGGPSEIVVYDTTSADVRLQLQGRHLVVSSPNADGVRSVIDVLEIENDTVVTRVAGAGNRATYSLLLPDGARNVRASQGEMSDGAVEVREGRADVYAPLSPGLRQLVLTYELPASVFPVSVPLERDVSVLEVLLEEPGATAEGGGLKSQGGVTVDGKTFTRYLGQSAPATAVVTLGVAKGIGGTSVPTWVLPLVLSLVTLGVILVVARRAPALARAIARARGVANHRGGRRAESLDGADAGAGDGRIDCVGGGSRVGRGRAGRDTAGRGGAVGTPRRGRRRTARARSRPACRAACRTAGLSCGPKGRTRGRACASDSSPVGWPYN